MSEKNQILPKIREAAKGLGYAIAVLGSMRRDFDLLAAPWIVEAVPAETLVQAIADIAGGYVLGDLSRRAGMEGPTIQPHGRRSWKICWGGQAFIDLSVMPRQAWGESQAAELPPMPMTGSFRT